MFSAIKKHSTARPAHEMEMRRRRPPRVRSRNGPSTGAMTANGAIVNSRYNSTLGRAASVPTEKNKESARAAGTKTSPQTPTGGGISSFANGEVGGGTRWCAITGQYRGPPGGGGRV